MGRLIFSLWCLVITCAFAWSAWQGYSPFGDGKAERDIYSRGGGPTHK